MSLKAFLTTSLPGPFPNEVALLIGTSVAMVAGDCLSVPGYHTQNAMSAAGIIKLNEKIDGLSKSPKNIFGSLF